MRLDEIVLRALEKEPELRFQHAREVKTQVETVATTPPPSVGKNEPLARPPVISAVRTDTAEPAVRPCQQPRLCLTAIVGAVWAGFFFLLLPLWLFNARPVTGTHGIEWWQWLLRFTVLPLGLTAPFGTTICGVVAISQIRHSGGQLYGLGLAVSDLLLFPLLLLNALPFLLVLLA